jgi:ketosteroid isomerase-like protein
MVALSGKLCDTPLSAPACAVGLPRISCDTPTRSRWPEEIVRRAWMTIASEGPEAALDYLTEDCVMEDFPELPDHAVYAGREGALVIDRHFREMWGDFVQEPVEFIHGGDGIVVAVIAMRGQGKGSGAPLDAQAVWVHELRAGKVARMRAFTTKAQALEAAGLSE